MPAENTLESLLSCHTFGSEKQFDNVRICITYFSVGSSRRQESQRFVLGDIIYTLLIGCYHLLDLLLNLLDLLSKKILKFDQKYTTLNRGSLKKSVKTVTLGSVPSPLQCIGKYI